MQRRTLTRARDLASFRDALVTRALCYDLFEMAVTVAGGGLGIRSAGAFFPLDVGASTR